MTGNENYQRAKAKILGSLKGTQIEIAKQAGVSQPLVASWMQGRRTPNVEQLSKLARLVGMELVIEARPAKRAKKLSRK